MWVSIDEPQASSSSAQVYSQNTGCQINSTRRLRTSETNGGLKTELASKTHVLSLSHLALVTWSLSITWQILFLMEGSAKDDEVERGALQSSLKGHKRGARKMLQRRSEISIFKLNDANHPQEARSLCEGIDLWGGKEDGEEDGKALSPNKEVRERSSSTKLFAEIEAFRARDHRGRQEMRLDRAQSTGNKPSRRQFDSLG